MEYEQLAALIKPELSYFQCPSVLYKPLTRHEHAVWGGLSQWSNHQDIVKASITVCEFNVLYGSVNYMPLRVILKAAGITEDDLHHLTTRAFYHERLRRYVMIRAMIGQDRQLRGSVAYVSQRAYSTWLEIMSAELRRVERMHADIAKHESKSLL